LGILDKLRGNDKKNEQTPTVVELPPCPHTTMCPHWDKPEDMGHEERAESFTCEACHQTFTPDEARQLRETEGQRLQEQHEAAAASATTETPT
jgi:hypothetical protein